MEETPFLLVPCQAVSNNRASAFGSVQVLAEPSRVHPPKASEEAVSIVLFPAMPRMPGKRRACSASPFLRQWCQ